METDAYCTQCGKARNPSAEYCGKCGQAFENSSNRLTWRVSVPLITNRFVMSDVACACAVTVVISALILLIVMGFGSGWHDMGRAVEFALLFSAGAGAFIIIVSIITLAFIFGNRCPMEFVLSSDGVEMKNVSERARFIHRFACAAALIAGKPLMAGPGLAAQAAEQKNIAWQEVRSFRLYPKLGVIAVKGGCFNKIRLYCSKENYPAVQSFIEKKMKEKAPPASMET